MSNQPLSKSSLLAQLDLFTTLIPFVCIAALCLSFIMSPDGSSQVLETIRTFLGDELGRAQQYKQKELR